MDEDEVSRGSGDAPETKMTFPQDQSFRTELGDDDVLLGRGTGPNEFTGNIRYRRLVRQAISSVLPRDLASNKTALAQKVVDDVAKNGGRFVRKLSKGEVAALYDNLNPQSDSKAELATHMSKRSYIYIDVDRDVAIEKTKQSFRHQTRVKQKPPPKQPTNPTNTKRPIVLAAAEGPALTESSTGNSASVAVPISSRFPFLAAAPPSFPADLTRGLLGSTSDGTSNAPNHPLNQAALQTLLLRHLASQPLPRPVSVAGLPNNLAQLENQWPLLNQMTAALMARSSNTTLALELARQQQQQQQMQEQYALAALLATGQLPASNNSDSDIIASLIASSARPSLPQPSDVVTLMTLLQGGGGRLTNPDPSKILHQHLQHQQHQQTSDVARTAATNTERRTTSNLVDDTTTTDNTTVEDGKREARDTASTTSVQSSSKKKGEDGLA